MFTFDIQKIASDTQSTSHVLYQGAGQVHAGSSVYKSTLTVSLHWLPTPEIRVAGDGEGLPLQYCLGPAFDSLSICIEDRKLPISIGSTSGGKNFKFKGKLRESFETGSSQELRSLQFGIPNLPHYCDVSSGKHPLTRKEMHWSFGGWKLAIKAAIDETSSKLAQKDQGYAISHLGTLVRADGQSFLARDAEAIVDDLWVVFWFIRGIATMPILPTGYGDHGRPVWWALHCWDIYYSRGVFSWADVHHSGHFLDVFVGFMDARSDPKRWDVLKNVVQMYVMSNCNLGRLESSIVLVQQALELLGWHLLVIEKKVQSKTKFRKATAAENIAALMAELGLPGQVPTHMNAIDAIASDIAGVVAQVRNDIVHPERRILTPLNYFDVLVQTWKVGTWALEMGILALLGYKGKYADRRRENRWVGEVDDVPWI